MSEINKKINVATLTIRLTNGGTIVVDGNGGGAISLFGEV